MIEVAGDHTGRGFAMTDSVPSQPHTSRLAAAINDGSPEPDPEPDSCVEVLDPARLLDPAALRWLISRSIAAMAAINATGQVRARIVNDAEMAAAHERYSGIAGTTDVLTFDLRDSASPSPGDPLDVDLWICVDEARRHAADLGHTVERELLLYIIHGILHCSGFDDHEEDDHRAMHAEEDRILEAIGVGATFSTPTPPAREGAE
jgi:probable rRNA maturation factor